MEKIIIVRRQKDKEYTITIDGSTRTGFISKQDCQEWIGTMKAHGLFKDYKCYIEKDLDTLATLVPTYENPCQCPAIAR